MTSEEVKALRQALKCTARALGDAIGATQQEVMAWEREELFPTKRFIVLMRRLADGGREELDAMTRAAAAKKAGAPGAPAVRPRSAAEGPGAASPWRALSDPQLWALWRKLAAHEALRREVMALAARYGDPLDDA